MHAVSLKCISSLAQHAPSSALLETLYPVMGAVPLLPGEALTEELAGSGQCLKLREFDIMAPQNRKGRNYNAFSLCLSYEEAKARRA